MKPSDCTTADQARHVALGVNEARVAVESSSLLPLLKRRLQDIEMAFWKRCDELSGVELKRRRAAGKRDP